MVLKSQKLRVLITAGPTREYLDPVRYLSNDSSGQMGFALARAATELGFAVTLIAGPVALPTPAGVRRIDVISAQEMQRATLRCAPKADIVIMAAAVADWRPERRHAQKLKKGDRRPAIALVENPDILAALCRRKRRGQTIVGFALETDRLEARARAKLARKRCDWIVANAASAIGAAKSRAILLSAGGQRILLPVLPKEDLAILILSHLVG
jgi:phosphopantothenoylcysteine decarboxylase / phosphopantothenate---cysteine ligase